MCRICWWVLITCLVGDLHFVSGMPADNCGLQTASFFSSESTFDAVLAVTTVFSGGSYVSVNVIHSSLAVHFSNTGHSIARERKLQQLPGVHQLS